MQESKQLKSSEEIGFELALVKPKISKAPLEDLKQALRYVFVLIGLKADQIPVEEEKALLMEYIVENYGGHTADEIKLAFKMAIQGKLPLDFKEVRSYGNFSPMYFTVIMDAYRIWAREQAEKLQRNINEPLITERQKLNINIDYAVYLLNLINKLPIQIGNRR